MVPIQSDRYSAAIAFVLVRGTLFALNDIFGLVDVVDNDFYYKNHAIGPDERNV